MSIEKERRQGVIGMIVICALIVLITWYTDPRRDPHLLHIEAAKRESFGEPAKPRGHGQ